MYTKLMEIGKEVRTVKLPKEEPFTLPKRDVPVKVPKQEPIPAR